MFCRLVARAPEIRPMSRANGSSRRRALESLTSRPVAGSSASAPFARSSFRNCWVSASREASTSSGFTCGAVEARGIVEPSCTCGADWVPGSTSTTMSLRPVFGRSKSDEFVWISGAYLLSISIPTTAWPSWRVTLLTSPTLMPEMSTDCPWPGVTACAVEKSALSAKRSVPISGTQLGRTARWLTRITVMAKMPARISPMIASTSRRWALRARLMDTGPGQAGPGWPPARSDRGLGCSDR